ncbi:ExeM/NucH family extracellular endonuclease [Diaphorobacter caeni]|uniref:ExeM/NucH family extracellular endonuclease n=1 Tax=Diaphorobacter caeni TaxID=2784387 RepID=UPI0018901642|nr:ExeM/NucH family extracellular endonuclease [Diaphorobacter caeni]MBF5005677.1 ExeM/NucH family extracellular endonuclease [Diaphorobacter caeni]
MTHPWEGGAFFGNTYMTTAFTHRTSSTVFNPTAITRARMHWQALGGALLFGLASTCASAGPVSFTGHYEQNFDALASTGTANVWDNGNTLTGWSLFRHDNSAFTTYRGGTGSDNAGAFYSFGAAGSTERALGILISANAFNNPIAGSVAGWMALALTNDTEALIDALNVKFNGEQWRSGGNTNAQTMGLQYGIGDSFDAVANWQDAGDLFRWSTPVVGATIVSSIGNDSGRVSGLGGDLRNLQWAKGQTLWLRWVNTRIASSNHGMAIDDLVVKTAGADIAAPTLSSSVPAAGATGVATTTSSIALSFNESVQAGTGSFELRQGASVLATMPVTDASRVAINAQTVTLTPGVSLQPNTAYSVVPVGTPVQDLSSNAWVVQSLSFTTGAAPTITRISAIQGSGDASTKLGTAVHVNAVVTAYMPDLSGFVMQEADADADADPATSEGIFVYYGGTNPGVSAATVGKRVQVSATVDEYNRQTQLKNLTAFEIIGDGVLPTPVSLTLPISDAALWERYEGMLVKVSSATSGGKLVISDNYTLGRYGDVTLSADRVLPQFTDENEPSVSGFTEYADTMRRSQIILDDNSSKSNPAAVRGRNGQPLSASNPLRAGDGVDAVIGVLDQFYQTSSPPEIYQTSYRVQPTQPLNFTGAARPTAADLKAAVGAANVKVASANVLNFFSKVGDTSTSTKDVFTPPTAGSSPIGIRGANNAAELDRQKAKVVANLVGLDADVYGLMEVQNNGFDASSALQLLVDAMNASTDKPAGAIFDFIKAPFKQNGGADMAGAGTDAITVAIVYRSDRVTPEGQAAVPNVATYDAFTPGVGGARVPIAQTFSFTAPTGKESFTFVVNHFKSKGSVLSSGDNGDKGDGQGANNPARVKTAEQLKAWLATKPTGAVGENTILVGDFNAYAKEKPITYLEKNGFSKVSHGYSYSFDGLWGSLDHIFVNTQLAGKVGNVVKWAINAEEPTVLDYNTEYKSADQIANYYAATAYRSSDHNPIVMGLNFATAPANQPPSIHGVPTSVTAVDVGVATNLSAITVADVDSEQLTLTLSATNGALQGVTDADAQLAGLQLKGSPAAINAELAKASFVAAATGDASVGLSLDDGVNAAVTATYAFKASAVVTPGTGFELSPAAGASVTGTLQGAGCKLASPPQYVTPQSLGITAMPSAGASLPHGLLVLNAAGCDAGGSLTVSMNYSQPLPEGAELWKWGRTADNTAKHWYRVPYKVSGQTVSFTLQDGGLGDDDLKADGNIADPTALVAPQAVTPSGATVAVPVMNVWGLVLLALSFLPFAPLARRWSRRG